MEGYRGRLEGDRHQYYRKTLVEAAKLGLLPKDIYDIINRKNVSVMRVVSELIRQKIDPCKARKVSEKCYSWKYFNSIIGYAIKKTEYNLPNAVAGCLEYADFKKAPPLPLKKFKKKARRLDFR